MSKKGEDILQIKKYLDGELDAKAMHRLERQAQHDPFLMDALEGYQFVKKDQAPNLEDLADRLKNRVAQKKGRIIPFKLIGIAASVLIICTAGLWWLTRDNKQVTPLNNKQTASVVKPEVKPVVTPAARLPEDRKMFAQQAAKATSLQTKPSPKKGAGQTAYPLIVADARVDTSLFVKKRAAFKPTALQEQALSKPVAGSKNAETVKTDTTPLNEMIAMEYGAQKKKDTPASILKPGYKNVKIATNSNPVQLIQGRAAGVTVVQNAGNNSQNNINGVALPPDVAAAADRLRAKGLMTSEEINKGQQLVTKADATNPGVSKGAGSNKDNPAAAYKGGDAGKTDAAASDSSGKNPAKQGTGDLAEVVVTGYTSQPKDANEYFVKAHPQDGWASFRKYLKINAVSPDGIGGVVKLTFMVDRYGSITGIKIIRGLSDAANKKAVSVIKDGPAWIGNSNNTPQKINLSVRFTKQPVNN